MSTLLMVFTVLVAKQKKWREKRQGKVESYPVIIWVVITSPVPITAEFLKQCCQTLRRLWLCSNTNLTDFSPTLLPFHNAPLLKPNITATACLTPQWHISLPSRPRHNPPILHHQFHWNTGPHFPCLLSHFKLLTLFSNSLQPYCGHLPSEISPHSPLQKP